MPKISSSASHVSGGSRRDPLLKTKLYIPLPRAGCVSRPRLTEKLTQGLARPLTLISAPAGFGKTTLISEWYASSADRDRRLAWLSLDDDDNDATRFWAYVIAALQTLQSTMGAEALVMLHAGWRQASLPKAFLTSLINDLTNLNADSVLVLDDYHVIESRLIHDALTYWLEHLPPHLHLVIASRTDPSLSLARLRARNQLVEIRAADLRFTPEEAALFLNQVTGLGLTPQDVAALESRTEGWIAGLQLAAIALRTRLTQTEPLRAPPTTQGRSDVSSFIAAFTGSNRYVLDYLVEEVLNRQSEGVQTFLLQTSILDQLCAPLCDAVTGRSDSQAILQLLDQSNLFTTPLDEERRWYRYHPLFAEFLHSRLVFTQPDDVPELHRRAMEWYERQGLIDEAVTHALAIQDWVHAARLIEQFSQTLLMRGEMITLQNWLQALPDDLIRSQPRLCILMAWSHILELRMDVAEIYLRNADQLIAAAQSPTSEDYASLESEMEAIRSVEYMFQGETHRAAELARQALEHSRENNEFLRSIIALDMSFSQVMSGDAQTANQALTETIRLSQQAQNTMVAVISMAQLAEQYIAQGHLHQAADLYRQAIQLADEHTPPPPVISMAYNGLGEVLREWNQLAEAMQALNKGIELGRRWNAAMSMDGYISLARVNQARGDTEAALEIMHKTHELIRRFESVMSDMMISAFDVRLWIAQGNLEAVAQWVQEVQKDERIQWNESPYPYLLREMTQLILAHAQLALDNPKDTLALIEQLAPEAETLGRRGIIIELTMLKALALQALGEMPQALAALKQALSQAEPEGYARLFADKGEPMRLLLQRMKNSSVDSSLAAYVDKLLAAYPKSESETLRSKDEQTLQPSAFGLQPLAAPLSERELEVLRMIAAGLSNQEIADRLVVAYSTVKTHINNIYNKLGVNSRVQAVTRAHELKLL